jgi:hypothetical protein
MTATQSIAPPERTAPPWGDTLPSLLPSDATNLAGTETGREHLSHSALNTLLACEQRYSYERVHRIELVEKPKPLSMGRAFQLAIEHGDPQAGATALAEDRIAFSQQDQDTLRIDMAIVMCAATAYLERWPNREGGVREFEYMVRLRNPHTGRYSNTFDLLGYADELFDLGDSWELVENKLVGQVAAVAVRKLPLDRQLALECYGVWRATGKPVSRVQYRFTRKPSIKPKQGESVEQFVRRLQGDYRARRDDFYLHEEELFRSTDDLVRIEAELWRWAEQLRAARREAVWARNSSHCHDYGGCPFIPLCVGDPDAPALYRERPERETNNDEEVALG